MMSKFTVEEINFMCVFETQDRMQMLENINNGQRYGGACRAGLGKTSEHD